MAQTWRDLPLGRKTLVMGVINVTPDSVRGDGLGTDLERVIAAGRALIAAGADFLDVGGESTRPRAVPVTGSEELHRVIPAIAALRDTVDVPISVDTMKAVVAHAALLAGACIVNDVSGLRADPALLGAVVEHNAAVIIGHWARREWGTEIPGGGDPVAVVASHLLAQAVLAESRGASRPGIWLDPGLGFGKKAQTSLALLRDIEQIVALGYPVVVGPSGKAFASATSEGWHSPPDWPSVAALIALAIAGGVQVVRVHDVHRHARVARMADAILRARCADFKV